MSQASDWVLQRLIWSALDQNEQRAALARPLADQNQALAESVADIIRQVRENGDQALREYARRFDQVTLDSLVADTAAIERPDADTEAVLLALDQAIERLRRFHAAGRPVDYKVETAPGVVCSARYVPLQRVGLYIPAGSAPLISTLIMLAIPAQLAGCDDIVLCSPPQADGEISSLVLAAAQRVGINRVYRCGGAQAIAAMAFGTASIPRCDKIFGPGNRWVTEAKRQVAAATDGTAIDMPAGPSEVMVIADAQADPHRVAIDLLSQAEHGPDSQVLLVTDSAALVDQVEASLKRWLLLLPRADVARQALGHSRAIVVKDANTALTVANAYAPEHLILQTTDAELMSQRVTCAGSVFIGPWTPESLGDYCSGTNHVLPTSGWARSHSGLSLIDFMRRITFQQATAAGLAQIGSVAETLAASEGLDAHRLAVSYRLGSVFP
ncbi:MAG: histidinol dehydrogenase [Wenzhouxiangellaceae bacterium]